MPSSCAVFDCFSIRVDDTQRSFFRFPSVNKSFKNEKEKKFTARRLKKWIRASKRKHINKNNVENLRVCSNYFLLGTYQALFVNTLV